MKLFKFKKIAVVAGLSIAAVTAATLDTSAQNRRWDDKEQRKIEKQQEKIEKQRAKLREQRQKIRQERQEDRYERTYNNGYYNNNDGYNDNGYYNNRGYNDRYRVYRSGRYYETDQRGAELLRQAVNSGYQQGYQAGQYDRQYGRRGNWTTSDVYRSGSYGYESSVDRSQYQYYFQQGFQRGYQDGYNSQTRYGSFNNGGMSILGSILSSILNIRQY